MAKDEGAARALADEARQDAVEAQKKEAEERHKVEIERDAKDNALKRAEGLRLTAQASAELATNPELALLLAIEGAKLHPGPLANNALIAALDAGFEHKTLIGHPYQVLSAAFNPDGRKVLTTTGRGDMTARIWDAATGKELIVLKDAWIQSAQFSPDGSLVVTGGHIKTTPRIWEVATGKELLALEGQLGTVPAGAFSPESLRGVIPAPDHTVRILDAKNGKKLLTLKGHSGPIHSAVFSPNGRRVLTYSSDQTVRVWDVATSQELFSLNWLVGKFVNYSRTANGQPILSQIRSAAFSPDSRKILTVSDDFACRIWDTETGRELITLRFGVWETLAAVLCSSPYTGVCGPLTPEWPT